MIKIVKEKIKSSKGNLSAAVHYPEKETGKLAILCSGFLDSKDYAHLVGLADALAGEGYVAVRFDATGIWESEGDISEYTTTQYLEDIKNVLEFMLSRSDYGHILLGGHSRGGMVSIIYASGDPRISAVLGIMPSPGGKETSDEKKEKWRKDGFKISTRDVPGDEEKTVEFKVPFAHVEDKEKYDAIEKVKEVKVPVILFAGEKDDVILPEWVRMIYDNANEPKKFILIPGIDHDYRHNDSEIDFVNGKIIHELIQ